MNSNQAIIVNATALDFSGALGILRQFIDNIPQEKEYQWLIFISDKVSLTSNHPNIILKPIGNVKSLIYRFLWDTIGVKRWLKNNGIIPIATISLQNTGFNCGFDVPNFIYYHQSIPLINFRWSIMNKEHRSLWFYKNIYPVFIKLFLRQSTVIFVQLNYIKELFHKKFKVKLDNIHVISPSVHIPNTTSIDPIILPEKYINLFYPATPVFYKNYTLLIDAVTELHHLAKLYITFDLNHIKNKSNINCIGRLKYEEVMAMYQSCDALVFPSYIETYGLPLIEAASLGVPIIAADLPYAREVLEGYDGAIFVPYNDTDRWKDAISALKKGERFTPLQINNRHSWGKLFSIIEENINK